MTPFLVLTILLFALVGACSPKADPPRNGVDDIRKACEIRTTWLNPTNQKCVNCQAAAPSPACDCELFKEFGGLCKSQDDARRAEPTCTDAMDQCTKHCPMNDCACVENCYAQAPTCKNLIAARDGCVVDVCTQYCK